MPCYSPLKGWRDVETGGIVFKASRKAYETMEVACGQCLGCRLDHSRHWAMRIIHESCLHEYSGGNSFITLTYRDKAACTEDEFRSGFFIPDSWSLNKKHFQDFMKRLRSRYPDKEIRFFHCGEYGNICRHKSEVKDCAICTVGRPHYHAVLFNHTFDDLEVIGTNQGRVLYSSPTLAEIWKYGHVQVGDVTFESAGYVARYSLKKITGNLAEDHYVSVDEDGRLHYLEPEYITMSRRPGIAKDWYDKYVSDIFPSDEVPVPGAGVFKGVPRYYEKLLEADNPHMLESIKELRQVFMAAHADDYTPERLMSRYKVKKAQSAMLKRTM